MLSRYFYPSVENLFCGYLYVYLRELDDKIDAMSVSCLYNNYVAKLVSLAQHKVWELG